MSAASPYRIAGERLVHCEPELARSPAVALARPESEPGMEMVTVASAYEPDAEVETTIAHNILMTALCLGGLGVWFIAVIVVVNWLCGA